MSFHKENLSYFQSHLRFLIGTGNFFDFIDNGTVRNSGRKHHLGGKHIQHTLGNLLYLLVAVIRSKLLHYNNILLIHGCNKVIALCGEEFLQGFLHRAVHIFMRLNQEYNSPYTDFDVQLLRSVINVYKKQIIQKKILDKIVLIEFLSVRYQKGLNL